MKRQRNADLRVGLILAGAVAVLAIVSLFYTPYDPYAISAAQAFLPPSFAHPFGTDNFGRDNFCRAVTGARYSLFVAGSTVVLSGTAGVFLGLFTGFYGGAADELIMRFMDALASFPGVLLALVTVTVLSAGKYAIIPALAVAFLPSFTRIVRSGAMRLKSRDFVDAARVGGASDTRIMFRYLLPNLLPTLSTAVVVGLSNAILAESGMSYLGLGIQPPIPSWGRMLFEGQAYLFKAPWEALSAGLMMVVTVLGFHCVGEGLSGRPGKSG